MEEIIRKLEIEMAKIETRKIITETEFRHLEGEIVGIRQAIEILSKYEKEE